VLFEQPLEGGNTFACATCHALSEPAADGFRRPGHPLGDATRRPSYKNGQISEMREAVNTCLTEWMTAEPWTADDPDWLALHEFLDARATVDEAPALSFEIVQPPAELGGGDVAAGRALFDGSCAVCHGVGASGTERAPALVGDLLTADYVAARVRTSGSSQSAVYPNLTGGRMPFWARDRLSDDELRDVIAFAVSNEPDPDPPDAGPSGGDPDAGDDCGTTHPLVGQSAELSNQFHGVSGTATVIDDCTIEITSFNYDGGGIDVRVYGGLGGNYTAGFAMTDDLLRAGGYSDETIIARLPDSKTFDDLDGISIWCVAVGQSFGEAKY
jgi:mono/diheme cytochrome c family protein